MEKLGYVVLVIIVAVILTLISGYPLMLLWNALIPDIFGLPVITYWQAVGLALLSSILFKSYNYNKG